MLALKNIMDRFKSMKEKILSMGIIPYEQNVYIDDIIKEYDYISAANVEFEEYQSF